MNDAADQVPDEEPIKPSEDPDGYVQHPLSAIFPAMADDEFKALCEDIRVNGLLVPIDVVGMLVIDGWHRYRACGVVGCPRRFNKIDDTIDKLVFVASKNLIRRHLTAGQRSIIANDIAKASRGGDRKSSAFHEARDARAELGPAEHMLDYSNLIRQNAHEFGV